MNETSNHETVVTLISPAYLNTRLELSLQLRQRIDLNIDLFYFLVGLMQAKERGIGTYRYFCID